MTVDEALQQRPTATDTELARDLGVSASTVRRARRRLGLPSPTPAGRPAVSPTPEALAAGRAALLEGLSLAQAGERSGLSKYHLEKLRIQIRAELGPDAAQPVLRGRPRESISIPVSRDEAADLERAAVSEGIPVAEVVRRRALEG